MSKRKRKGDIHVTDHALIRWLERAHGIDIAALKRAMLTPEHIRHIKNGASAIRTGGHQIIVEDGQTVVTVI